MKNIVTILIICLSMFALTAEGHSTVKSSNVKEGQHYEVAPATIDINFDHDVGLATVQLTNLSKQVIEVDFQKPKKMQSSFSVPVPELKKGFYTLVWRAIAKDGHVMTGKINFSVGG